MAEGTLDSEHHDDEDSTSAGPARSSEGGIPRRRAVLIGTTASVLLLVCIPLFVWMIGVAEIGKEESWSNARRRFDDARVMIERLDDVPAEDNAAGPLVEALGERLLLNLPGKQEPPGQRDSAGVFVSRRAGPSGSSAQDDATWVGTNKAALELLREASQRKRLSFEAVLGSREWPLYVDTRVLREGLDCLLTSASGCLDRNRTSEALIDLVAAYRLARLVSQTLVIIQQAVAEGIEQRAWELFGRLLERPAPVAFWSEARAVIVDLPPRPSLDATALSLRYFAVSAAGESARTAGVSDVEPVENRTSAWFDEFDECCSLSGYGESMACMEKLEGALRSRLKRGRWALWMPGSPDAEILAAAGANILIVPEYRTLLARHWRSRVREDLLKLSLDILSRDERLERAELKSLVERVDDPFVEGPARMLENASWIVVYSVGLNERDDGGEQGADLSVRLSSRLFE